MPLVIQAAASGATFRKIALGSRVTGRGKFNGAAAVGGTLYFAPHAQSRCTVKAPLWQRPSSPPAPPQGVPGGPVQLGIHRVAPGQ